MKEKIYLSKCDNYDKETVKTAIDNIFNSLGGINKIINPEDKVFIKINLLKKNSPDDAVTTHPAIVEEVIRHVQAAGGKVILGDSPGGPYTVNALKAIYAASGMIDVAERTGCELNYDVSSMNVKTDGLVAKSLDIITPVLDCDKVIAIGKLKTHVLMTATLSVKLCFGYIPGLFKADYHLRMPNANDFANLLIDIYEHRKPDLNIIDAVYGMEGDGPSAGNPIHVGCLVAGTNGHALDVLCSKIMGIPSMIIPTIRQAIERKLFTGNIEDIEVIGDDYNNYIKAFKHPRVKNFVKVSSHMPAFLREIFNNRLKAKPVFNTNKCEGCGICMKSCPAKTITIKNGKAIFDQSKCISCFCCHELCPVKAIDIRKPLISRILTRKK